MDKETLSNYGWIVICVLVLAVMIALATPFGSFVSEAVQSTTKGLFDVNKSALDSTGLININNQEFGSNNKNDIEELPAFNPTLNPDDGTTPTNGSVYKYGNYEYRYNQRFISSSWRTNTSQNGWGVRCINNVADPGPILESINGEPITDISYAFAFCSYLTVAPTIPRTVTCMNYAFVECESLEVAPKIPNGVTTMLQTFGSCKNLKRYVGSNVADGDFSKYVIPETVTDMRYTFEKCASLTISPIIPSNVTDVRYMFSGCSSLVNAPIIPDKVIYMDYAFQNCTSLVTAPVIPSSVTTIKETFKDCTSLSGTITINTTPSSYSNCLKNTNITEVLGSCANNIKTNILATK